MSILNNSEKSFIDFFNVGAGKDTIKKIEMKTNTVVNKLRKGENPWLSYKKENRVVFDKNIKDNFKSIQLSSGFNIVHTDDQNYIRKSIEDFMDSSTSDIPKYYCDPNINIIFMSKDIQKLEFEDKIDLYLKSISEMYILKTTENSNALSKNMKEISSFITMELTKEYSNMSYNSKLLEATNKSLEYAKEIEQNPKMLDECYSIAKKAFHASSIDLNNFLVKEVKENNYNEKIAHQNNNKKLVNNVLDIELKREREQLEKDINSLKVEKQKLTIENELLSKQNKTLEKRLEKTINKSISSIKEYVKSQEFVNELNDSLRIEDYSKVEKNLDDIISCTESLHKKELGLKKTIEIHAEKNKDFQKQREERLKQLQKEKEKELERIKKLEREKVKEKVNEKESEIELDDDDELEL